MVFSFMILLLGSVSGQEVSVHGFVRDAISEESLIGALVYDGEIATVTDQDGFFTLSIISDTVRVQYLGYESVTVKISSTGLSTTIYLKERDVLVDEVVISANSNDYKRQRNQSGVSSLTNRDIKKIPALLGESDPLKALQTKPGVQQGAEGTNGLFVRGGSTGQNLLLVEDVPLFNADHAFGLLSLIPASSVKSIDLYKGGFPSQYGNRLSSVIDVQLQDGNKKQSRTTVGLSNIAAQLHSQGPIIQDKLSYSVSGRYGLTSLFSDLSFYDGSVKLDFVPSEKHRVSAFVMTSSDKVESNTTDESNQFEALSNTNWQNAVASLKWKYFYSPKIVLDVLPYISRYKLSSTYDQIPTLMKTIQIESAYQSNIQDVGLKMNGKFYLSQNSTISLGLGTSLFSSVPENSSYLEKIDGETTLTGATKIPKQNSYLSFAYIQIDHQVSKRFGFFAGGRFNLYSADQVFSSVEPRAGMRYATRGGHTIKATYTIVNQYNHLISNFNINSPTDSWINASANLPPSTSWQTSLSFIPNIGNDKLWIETDIYYKHIRNDVRLKPGFLTDLSSFEDKVGQVDGTAYGWENTVKYDDKQWSYQLGYTLSKADRRFQDDNLNNGANFPFRYDRRHNINLLATYNFPSINKTSDRIINHSISSEWVYLSGANYTVNDIIIYNPEYVNDPTLPFAINRLFTTYPSAINNARAQAFHRLNISWKRECIRKNYRSTLSAGVYNAYARENVFVLTSRLEETPINGDDANMSNPQGNVGGLAINKNTFLPILPFVAYEIQF